MEPGTIKRKAGEMLLLLLFSLISKVIIFNHYVYELIPGSRSLSEKEWRSKQVEKKDSIWELSREQHPERLSGIGVGIYK